MPVFSQQDFADHEEVAFFADPAVGLKAIIAVHNTRLGPALGGCRMWPYESDQMALQDVLRLSRGMTYKSALANLPLGGGKSVVIGDPRSDKSDGLLRAVGRAVERVGGRYIAAEDSGTSVDDIKIIAEETRHVAGIRPKRTGSGDLRSGDPSPATAHGVFFGIRAAVKHRLGRDDLNGLKVAVQGVGSVGFRLAKQLHDAGAQLWVTDIHAEQCRRAREELGATVVAADQVYDLDVDVFSPCALGAVINDQTVPRLRATIVAGAANNVLAADRHGEALARRDILYAPDYAINAGGIIDIAYERAEEFDRDAMVAHVEGIYDTLMTIFERATADEPPNLIADRLAEQRWRK